MNGNRQGEGLEGICLGEVRKKDIFLGQKSALALTDVKKQFFVAKDFR